jgi:hypothetical protein
MNDLKISKKQRTYIPADLKMQWENLEPIFNELVNRPINSVSELGQWLRDRSEIEAALEEDFAWRYIRMTCDTTDEKLLNDFQFFATEIEPKIAPLNNELNKKFIQCPFAEELDKAKYFIYVRGIKKALELFREENIPLLTQIQVEQQKYQGITGSMSVKIGSQEYTLEQAAVFLKDTDRKVRQEAWEAITARRLEDKEKLDELFNSLLKLRHQVALNAGFENFRDYMFQALGRFDYTPTDCYDFHKAIQEEIVPLLKVQAGERLEALGLDELKPWDMDVDISSKPALKPFKNGEELIEKSIQCFRGLSPYIGERLEIMKANGFFDVDSRKGKAPGGYNYPLAESGAPFIFMNSAGTFRDLTTMVHEGGHAVLATVLPYSDPLHKVTILPRGMALGVTWSLPEERHTYSREYFEDVICKAMGGRVAEMMVFGALNSGAANDLEQATNIARRMVREWGMSDAVGPMAFAGQQQVFLGEDLMTSGREYSDEMARKIDDEISRIRREQETRARVTLEKHRRGLDLVAQALLDQETIDGAMVSRLIQQGLGEPSRQTTPNN